MSAYAVFLSYKVSDLCRKMQFFGKKTLFMAVNFTFNYLFVIRINWAWCRSVGDVGSGVGEAAVSVQGVGYDPLNLAVDRAKFLRGPTLDHIHSLRVEPKQESFALLSGHWFIDIACRC